MAFTSVTAVFILFLKFDKEKYETTQQQRYEQIADTFLSRFQFFPSAEDLQKLYNQFLVEPVDDANIKLKIINGTLPSDIPITQNKRAKVSLNMTLAKKMGIVFPFELIDISVGLITRFLYDSMYWGRNEKYTGRNRPLLMVYEEAHSYLPKSESSSHIYGYARKAVEKIFKEGRKFGIGSIVVTQRPSEISETILAQVGTFIALRLTNSSDKTGNSEAKI